MRRLGVSCLVWGILSPRMGSLACIKSRCDGTLCGDWACYGLCGVFCPRAWGDWENGVFCAGVHLRYWEGALRGISPAQGVDAYAPRRRREAHSGVGGGFPHQAVNMERAVGGGWAGEG